MIRSLAIETDPFIMIYFVLTLAFMLLCSTLVLSACMLSSQMSQRQGIDEQPLTTSRGGEIRSGRRSWDKQPSMEY